MRRIWLLAGLIVIFGLGGTSALAQTDTPTSTPTNTPTNTPTATAVIANTATPLPTSTPNSLPVIQAIPNPRVDGNLQVKGGSVILQPRIDGGERGQRNQFQGVPKTTLVALGTMTNGTTETTAYIDSSPTGEWSAIDSDVTVSADTSHYRVGTNSLKIAFGAGATDQDGAINNITNDDWEANESFGVWVMVSEATSAGDLALWVNDTSVNTRFLLPAISQPYTWQFFELPIDSLGSGSGNVVDKIAFIITTQGAAAHGAFDAYFTQAYKWDSTDEEALSVDAYCQPGAVNVFGLPTSSGSANTAVVLTEGTDYFEVCRPGATAIVTVTDQSANSGLAIVSVQ